MDDLLREFLTETYESLDRVDAELVRFEQVAGRPFTGASYYTPYLSAPAHSACAFTRKHALRASATRLEGPSRTAASVLPKGLISVAEKERVTARPPTAEDRQRAVNTTASPSVPAERTSPQSRAKMPA